MRDFFLMFSLHEQILFVYFVFINIITLFFFALDKYKSSGNFQRTPEKILWLLCLAGGSLGGLAAMHFFRHKTKKHSFQAVFFMILLLQISVLVFLNF